MGDGLKDTLKESGKKRRNEKFEEEDSNISAVPPKSSEGKNEEHNDDDEEDSSDDEDIVNVDFDYFNFKELDFHALKNLLRQLFDVDNVEFNLSYFADKIIQQPEIGSSVKADGPESDPFAILTVLDVSKYKKDADMKALIEYFILKTQESAEFNRKLRQLLSPGSTAKVGLLLSERLLNMPVEIVPPLYNMLVSELEVAADKAKDIKSDKESSESSYQYDYLLLPSKTFYEEESLLDQEESRPTKKGKKVKSSEEYFFHAEDELLHQEALYYTSYGFTNTNQESDSKRAFQDYGIFPRGHLMLLQGDKLDVIGKKLAKEYPLEAGQGQAGQGQ